MSHNLMHDKRFYTLREPAWHRLGYVSDEPLPAVAVGQRVGLPEVWQMPMYLQGTSTQVSVQGYRAIVGALPGDHGDGQRVNGHTIYTYGLVRDDYEVITHARFCELWDEVTGQAPVETLGLLGRGDKLFVTARLPTFEVRGDELDNYVLAVNPLDGQTAVTARTTSVRVVCQNTLYAALSGNTSHEYRGVHTRGLEARLQTWLQETWQAQTQAVAVLKEAYELLADKRCTEAMLIQVNDAVYPLPTRPDGLSGEAMAQAIAAWEAESLRQAEHRLGVVQLFEGSPHLSQATRGTLFGAVNSVVEYEQYGRARTTGLSQTFGEGSQRQRRAFATCLELARR